ncbi:unnamed protein product [Spirodela intermedia]|uniref:BAH domain-containing protein n=1 Tax=Spirodela intermedia TaxID=51605 RepID=A0A7I8ISG9_SPIIN|nr:unnamed protein product [Spirodela intermedia]CAA6660809.1 unnamed protein product [Spirodela intermedia]
MPDPEQVDTGAAQFAWGKKRGRGKGMNVQFYGSFAYDGTEYSLYDCVYLYKEGEPEPFIGKLIKIWEQHGSRRRVKILWFFRPIEIRNFLGEYEKPLKNEIFLASGEGIGVTDVNPCYCGKCNVICISKDQRNRQPSDEELKVVDYIFYRTFDVGSYTISDKIGETIAGVEATYIFNFKEGLSDNAADGRSGINGPSEKSSHTVDLVLESELVLGKEVRKADLSDARNDRSSKRMRLSDASRMQKSDMGSYGTEEKACAIATTPSTDKAKLKLDNDLLRLKKGSTGKLKPDAVANRPAGETFNTSTPDLSLQKRQNTNETDTSKWFVGPPWETRIWEAQEQGTLVLLENFDLMHTSEEIEDLIFHCFKKKCAARMIEWSTFSCPYHGRALIICKNRGDAEEIVKKLKANVLMLSNGRPLVGRMAALRPPGKACKFYGHYFIEKVRRQMQREEARNAVSTSHCSQPNTLEFEMGIEWMLLHEKSAAGGGSCTRSTSEHEKEVKLTARAPPKK